MSTTDRPEDRIAPDIAPAQDWFTDPEDRTGEVEPAPLGETQHASAPPRSEPPSEPPPAPRRPSRPVPGGRGRTPARTRGITRRQSLRRAVAGTIGLAAAGLAGYELHPDDSRAVAVTSTTSTTSTQDAVSAAVASAQAASAEVQSFITRPDLHPPAVKVTRFSGADVTPSYIVLSVTNVIANDQVQQGLMMLDRDGRLVWFQPVDTSMKPFDLNVFDDGGRTALTWWQGKLASSHGAGVGIAVDSRYAKLKEIRAGRGLQTDLHELNLTTRGTALVTAYEQTMTSLAPMGGSGTHPVFTCHAQEVDLASGKVLFDWSSLDHVGLAETYMSRPTTDQVLDYFHMNSIGETSDGNLLISGRNTSTLYKVDRSSGAILWRLGGKKSDFSFGTGAEFHWQHDGRAWSDSAYSVFDNGANGSEKRSRGLMLDVDESAMTASLAQAYLHPAAFLSQTLGSVTQLSDGRVFVGWGDQPYFSEFADDGALLLDGQLPVGVRSYRAFTVDWVGTPTERPRVVAKANPAGGFVVRASWNGATEINRWRILGGPSASRLEQVGSQIWTGFETAIAVNSPGPSFCAVALDSSGRELARSEVV